MGSVTVERRRAIWRDLLRSYAVVIDGHEAGKLRSGETRTFELEPGLHDVCMKIDWCRSPTLTVDGSVESQLLCDSNGTAFTALPEALFRSGDYIFLKRA